ncbi:hypothetical protein PL321_02875 [Caloramator sp. mosi_1]|uniref:hypothetical protein n=1 Tax=Caloramator sp. mosi_1 TaxID=3023090 RepID=UPI002360D673|nr:hypothetical protein [Caloramator sp. mosi_1]WDC84657.1 hypothetical protein PL321_02875 [Caloramator sp. mosi_1]
MADPTKFGVAIVTQKDIKRYNDLTYFYSIKGDLNNAKEYIDKEYKIIMWQDIKDNLRYILAKRKLNNFLNLLLKYLFCF